MQDDILKLHKNGAVAEYTLEYRDTSSNSHCIFWMAPKILFFKLKIVSHEIIFKGLKEIFK